MDGGAGEGKSFGKVRKATGFRVTRASTKYSRTVKILPLTSM